VRFTQKDGDLFVTLLEVPATRKFELWGVDVSSDLSRVEVLGLGDASSGGFSWCVTNDRLSIEMPDRLPVTPALVVRLTAADVKPS
jgi:hypothetical protein